MNFEIIMSGAHQLAVFGILIGCCFAVVRVGDLIKAKTELAKAQAVATLRNAGLR